MPRFTYPPVDLANSHKFQEVCLKLWEAGVVSTKTMLQTHGYDMDQEMERMKHEPARDKDAEKTRESSAFGDHEVGRPVMDDAERNSDPLKSQTGAQPKPSNPEGS